jgi:hypothetical protein
MVATTIIIPANQMFALQTTLLIMIFELLRIFFAYILCKPPNQIAKLQAEKFELQQELATIKSVNLEFVRHSLLSRKVIKIEKSIEGVKESQAPKIMRVKGFFRVLRMIAYIGYSALYIDVVVAYFDPAMLWPLNWFANTPTVALPCWAYVLFAGMAFRHLFRSLAFVMVGKFD